MAANSSLGAALGGEGDAERLPGRPLPALVLDRLGYPGAGAPRLVSAAWELLVRPRTWDQQNREFEEDHNPPYALDGIDNGPALNAMFDRYLEWYWRRARVCVFGRRDPAQPKICSFFPHKDGRARCWRCRVDTSARDAVAGTPELSRQVAAFLVGDIASIRA